MAKVAFFWTALVVLHNSFIRSSQTTPDNVDSSLRVFSKGDLTTHDILLLSICGHVFDVESGSRFYGPGGAYEVFGRKDATKSLARSNVSDENLTDDVSSLIGDECIAAEGWLKYFHGHETYKHVGVLHGYFFNSDGVETEGMQNFKRCVTSGHQINKVKENEITHDYDNIDAPECNRIIRESDKMHIISCDPGYTPRKSYFTAGQTVNPDGSPRSINIISCICLGLNNVDDRPDLQLYSDDCHPHSTDCVFDNHENDIHH